MIQLLPHGLMYRSYRAGPRERQFGYEWLYDTRREEWVNEVTLGAVWVSCDSETTTHNRRKAGSSTS